jgi:hypothetical protein
MAESCIPDVVTKPTIVERKPCEVCEEQTDWGRYFDEEIWCLQCGISQSMLEGQKMPGGCEDHPDATHEEGFGLAGGGFGVYSVCNACGSVFDKVLLPEDMA